MDLNAYYYYLPTDKTVISDITDWENPVMCEGKGCQNVAEYQIYPKGMTPEISQFFTSGKIESVRFCTDCATIRTFKLPEKLTKGSLDNKKPYIICSAIHFDDGLQHEHQPKNIETGFVVAGRRHHNIFMTMKILGYDRLLARKGIQGFLTSMDTFIEREDAMVMGLSNGQVDSNLTNKRLFSEDLY